MSECNQMYFISEETKRQCEIKLINAKIELVEALTKEIKGHIETRDLLNAAFDVLGKEE